MRTRVTLNRPEKRNALSLELMESLIGSHGARGADPDVRAIVVQGAGVSNSRTYSGSASAPAASFRTGVAIAAPLLSSIVGVLLDAA